MVDLVCRNADMEQPGEIVESTGRYLTIPRSHGGSKLHESASRTELQIIPSAARAFDSGGFANRVLPRMLAVAAEGRVMRSGEALFEIKAVVSSLSSSPSAATARKVTVDPELTSMMLIFRRGGRLLQEHTMNGNRFSSAA